MYKIIKYKLRIKQNYFFMRNLYKTGHLELFFIAYNDSIQHFTPCPKNSESPKKTFFKQFPYFSSWIKKS